MTVLSRAIYILALADALVIAISALLSYMYFATTYAQLALLILISLVVTLVTLNIKGFYNIRKYSFKDIYFLFEAVLISVFISAICALPIIKTLAISLILFNFIFIYFSIT